MIGSDLYWTIITGFVTCVWVIVSTIRTRKILTLERSHELAKRLLEGDKIKIEHPEIQKYLSSTALKDEEYFRSESALDDILFFKSKSYVYMQINFFDDILSAANEIKKTTILFRPPQVLDLNDWEAYIIQKLRHPLYRSIMKNESHIFGGALRTFWTAHSDTIIDSEPDRFSW